MFRWISAILMFVWASLLPVSLLMAETVLAEVHPEFDWKTIDQMKASGAQGVATSFKVVAGSADVSSPFISIYPKKNRLEGKYLVANFSAQRDRFQFFCFLDYELVNCQNGQQNPIEENPSVLMSAGDVQVIPVQIDLEAGKSQDFLLIGIALNSALDHVSYRATLNPTERKAERKIEQSDWWHADSVSDFSDGPDTMELSQKTEQAYFRVGNEDNAKKAFVFSVCVNQRKSAHIMESGFLELQQLKRYAFTLKAQPERPCDRLQFGMLDNPYTMLEKGGKILQSLSVDFSDVYDLPYYYAISLPD